LGTEAEGVRVATQCSHARVRRRVIEYPAQLGDALTRVLESGPVDGPVVLALHGVGARADRWRPAMELLGDKGFRVIAIDLPGHGFAAKGGDLNCSPAKVMDSLESFCASFGISRLAIMGTSLGALYAATLALKRPNLVSGVVLIGALGLEPLGPTGRAQASNSVVRTSEEDIERKLRRLFFDQELVTSSIVDEEFRINTSPGAAESLASYSEYFAKSIDDDVVGDRLASTGTPVLLVWGSHDQAVSVEVGVRATRRIPRWNLVEINNAGHAPYLEQPTTFCAGVAPFLRGLQ
jgi:pimeloyl-ACP methyl ester carboxylesterase